VPLWDEYAVGVRFTLGDSVLAYGLGMIAGCVDR
jgi:hypothetical protein